MQLDRVWLTDFRSYASAEVALAPGLTAVVGANGEGKSNLLEAIGWMGGLRSFRAAPTEALVRVGAERAFIRGEGSRAGRALLVECEVAPGGRSRMLVNRQPVRRARDGLDFLRAVVFAPDDLELVKGGPGERRRYLDDLLVALDPRLDPVRSDLDRILKQRSALLKQAGGRLSEDIAPTLEVWDARLARRRARPWPTPGWTWWRCWGRWSRRPTATWPAGATSVLVLRPAVAGRGPAGRAGRRRAATSCAGG